jgi:hypothetical protein
MRKQAVFVCALGALGLFGCGNSRDVDVTGSVGAPANGSVSGPITLEFFDVSGTDTPKSVARVQLDAPGNFDQKVSVSGDTVRVLALVDENGDGTCTTGELWAETDAPIDANDAVTPLTLVLAADPCPSTK